VCQRSNEEVGQKFPPKFVFLGPGAGWGMPPCNYCPLKSRLT
jgi:hypothetical protein